VIHLPSARELAMTIAAAALAAPASAAPPDVAPIVEAERAFAAMAQVKGVSPAFRAFAADDGVLMVPDPRNAREVLASGPEIQGTLVWWPVYAGIAASQDLGFTTGPYVHQVGGRRRDGWFFTIWKKQADGNWRWLFDNGQTAREAAPLGPDAQISTLPAAAAPRPGRADWAQVLQAEARLAAALAADAPKAYAAVLADDGRLLRQGPQPAIGRAACTDLLKAEPPHIEAKTLGGGLSKAGDLAWTYGRAHWIGAGGPVSANYVRIWQQRSKGWRLVIDETIPFPTPPPDPPQGEAARR
jgi:ketosteroid isomerase-like protein